MIIITFATLSTLFGCVFILMMVAGYFQNASANKKAKELAESLKTAVEDPTVKKSSSKPIPPIIQKSVDMFKSFLLFLLICVVLTIGIAYISGAFTKHTPDKVTKPVVTETQPPAEQAYGDDRDKKVNARELNLIWDEKELKEFTNDVNIENQTSPTVEFNVYRGERKALNNFNKNGRVFAKDMTLNHLNELFDEDVRKHPERYTDNN